MGTVPSNSKSKESVDVNETSTKALFNATEMPPIIRYLPALSPDWGTKKPIPQYELAFHLNLINGICNLVS